MKQILSMQHVILSTSHVLTCIGNSAAPSARHRQLGAPFLVTPVVEPALGSRAHVDHEIELDLSPQITASPWRYHGMSIRWLCRCWKAIRCCSYWRWHGHGRCCC